MYPLAGSTNSSPLSLASAAVGPLLDRPQPVLVVGAGPSGLMCALVLAQQGVPVHVVERSPTPITQTRAMFIQPRTLELWDRLGLSEVALARGSRVNAVSIWRAGREVSRLSIPAALGGHSAFPHALGLPQDQTQAMLLGALFEHPHCQIHWGATLRGLSQSAEQVTATVDGPDGPFTLTGSYLVGADGGRSTVRGLLGVPMEGFTYELAEVGGDVDLPAGLPRDAMVSSSSMARGLSVMPIGGERFRVFGTLTPELARLLQFDGDATKLRLEQFVAWFEEVFPDQPPPTRLHRAFAYRIHKRVAARFREHRVFLVGDAAHMNPPAGGQGINLGMGDGFNLGWKLALVCQGLAYPALLDSYEAERLPLAHTVVGAVDRLYQADQAGVGPFSQVSGAVSSAAMSLLMRVPLIRNQLVNLIGQTWIRYRPPFAGLDRGPKRGLRVGARVPTLPELAERGLNRVQFHLLLFGGLRPSLHTSVSELADALSACLASIQLPVNVQRIPANATALHRRFGAQRALFVLVRPDGHILFRGQTLADVAALENLLRRWFAPRPYAPARDLSIEFPAGSDVFQAAHSAGVGEAARG